MAVLGNTYSFSEEFIENAVIQVFEEGTTTPAASVPLIITFTGYGESSINSTTDANGLSDFFLVDFDTSTAISVEVLGSPFINNFNHSGGDLELFSFEQQSTNSQVLIGLADTECANQEYYLTWINSLGGYEFWKFTARATKGLIKLEKNVFNKDVFQDWDNDFINGKRDKKYLLTDGNQIEH